MLAEQSGVFESVWFGDSLIHKPRLGIDRDAQRGAQRAPEKFVSA